MHLPTYSYSGLRRDARKACSFRGHKMGNFKRLGRPDSNPRFIRAEAKCKVCGKEVYVDIHPAPNGIDIAGPAVALCCN